MQKPILHMFLISHYCEKARWALDLAGVDYQVNLLSPLEHAATAKKVGASGSALPILEIPAAQNHTATVIQGSSDIVVWANQQAALNSEPGLAVSPQSIEIEKRLDDILGVQVRRWFYSEALLDCPGSIMPVFAEGSGILKRMVLRLAWPKVTAVMIRRMDLGARQEIEAHNIVAGELDWLDSLLVDGQEFLSGDSLSNADIAAASLLAPLFAPAKHPAVKLIKLPPRTAATVQKWQSRPFAQWLTKLYSDKR